MQSSQTQLLAQLEGSRLPPLTRFRRFQAAAAHLAVLLRSKFNTVNLPRCRRDGTIDGSHFTLDIALNLSQLSGSSTGSLGTISGSFRSQPVNAIITSDPSFNAFDFSGTIGPTHVSGVIK